MTGLTRFLIGRPTPLRGVSWSAAAHLGAIAGSLIWGAYAISTPDDPVSFAGAERVLQLQVEVLPAPAVESSTAPATRIVITPAEAQIDTRRFTHHRATVPPIAEFAQVSLPSAATPARIPHSEMVPPLEQPEQWRPTSKRTPAATLPTAALVIPQTAGTANDRPPRFVNNPPPVYPAEAVRRRLAGVTLLRVWISAEGHVEAVQVARSSGHPVLDAAAAAAVRRWQAEPARRAGVPTSTIELLPIRFRLR